LNILLGAHSPVGTRIGVSGRGERTRYGVEEVGQGVSEEPKREEEEGATYAGSESVL